MWYRTTKTDFRLCSTDMSHSQADLCFCTLQLIFSQLESTFVLFRYALEKHRPSETTHHSLFWPNVWPSGHEVRKKIRIESVVSQLWLLQRSLDRNCDLKRSKLQYSLPHKLHIQILFSMKDYRKGQQGLLVPQEGLRICTENSISLSFISRQQGDDSIIHAGQKLLGKEFRYIITVRITAAIYSTLMKAQKTLNLSFGALGRFQTLYSIFRFCNVLCFW